MLQVLKENKLFLHPEKCEFYKQQIEYLGLVISENEVSMDPVKVAGVQDGCPGFPRLCELLPEVHSGLFCQSLIPL